MTPTQTPGTDPWGSLRRFAQPKAPRERCELCSAGLEPEHEHLMEPATRKLLCACGPCAVLFTNAPDGRFRRVPRRVELLANFRLSDAQWEELHLPISLAFFFRSTPDRRVLAYYPSPAGPMESLLPLESWDRLVLENPVLGDFEPDVEALLVNRVGATREHFRVPIDECFKLVGLLRTHWRGLSGGSAVWTEIASYFDRLRACSNPSGARAHA